MRQPKRPALLAATIAVALIAMSVVVPAAHGALSTEITSALATSKYVYIASTRKDGTLGKPAEIWFMYRNGAVYVGTPATSWRARRIKAGRPQAKIWVGKADGPSFTATGAIVNEPDTQQAMLDAFGKKYPEGWSRHEEKFRSGFKDGSRVLLKYTPKD